MGVSKNVSEENQTQKTGLAAAGAKLAKERERQQRTVESVASDLHLRPEIVRAIENGDEAQLPAVTFIRGYIKIYARLLAVDDTALVAQLPAAVEHSPEPLKRVGMRRAGISLPSGKWFIWTLVLGVLLLLVVYGAPVLERLWTSTGSSEAPADQLQLPQAEPAEKDDSTTITLPETLPLVEQETVETPEPEPVMQPPAEHVAVEKPVEPETATQETVTQETATQETVGPALIQMRFSEDSWVEMEAHGRKLVVGTQYAGSERTVRAEPPIQILLGNAPGVELVYRGEVVDIKPYQRGKVARLILED